MEKNLQKKVVDYIRLKGYECYSINPPNYKRMTYGTLFNLPDIHIVDFNTYIELKDFEYKSAHKDRQEKQKQRRKELTRHGAKCYKANTFENVCKIVNFLKK